MVKLNKVRISKQIDRLNFCRSLMIAMLVILLLSGFSLSAQIADTTANDAQPDQTEDTDGDKGSTNDKNGDKKIDLDPTKLQNQEKYF